MKWFVLVIVMGMYGNGDQDVYVYDEPKLDSLEQCQSWVYTSSAALRVDIQRKFEGRQPQQVFCIREDKLEEFLKLSQGDPA